MHSLEIPMAAMKRLWVCALVVLIAAPAFAQSKKNEHWVAT